VNQRIGSTCVRCVEIRPGEVERWKLRPASKGDTFFGGVYIGRCFLDLGAIRQRFLFPVRVKRLATALLVCISLQVAAYGSRLTTIELQPRLVASVDKFLELSDDQKAKIEPIVQAHAATVAAILADRSITGKARIQKIHEDYKKMGGEITPYLIDAQIKWVPKMVQLLKPDGSIAHVSAIPGVDLISIGYEAYMPSGSLARSIFGNSSGAFQLGLTDFETSSDDRFHFGVSTDGVSIGSSNKLFVFSEQVGADYKIPIANRFSAFIGLAAGPAYMDYSFDTPSGAHYGAKRIGADALARVGVRYCGFQLAANYHYLTEPAGINFSGLDLTVTYVLFHF